MGRWAIGVIAVVGGLLAAPACDGGATEEAACEHVCECFYFFPSDQRACAAQCEPELAGWPQECLDCLASRECRELESDACTLECPIFFVAPGGNDEVR